MVQIHNLQREAPWSVAIVVNSIRSLIKNMLVRVVHSLREGNTLANFSTNLVFDFVGDFEYRSLEQALVGERYIINMDNTGTPNIRRIIQ